MVGSGITNIGYYAFEDCKKITNVYYNGTIDEWNNIGIDEGNYYLSNATIYYYTETEPTEAGNYWHYVEGIPTRW